MGLIGELKKIKSSIQALYYIRAIFRILKKNEKQGIIFKIYVFFKIKLKFS